MPFVKLSETDSAPQLELIRFSVPNLSNLPKMKKKKKTSPHQGTEPCPLA